MQLVTIRELSSKSSTICLKILQPRRTVNEITPATVSLIKDFKVHIIDEVSGKITDLPNKELVKYMGINFDYLLRLNKHHAIQLAKAKKTFRAHSKIFYNSYLEPKAKLICYILLIRPIMTYAAPIWWNVRSSVMEHYR
ncbi:hypothetical protein M0802_009625 [Mischocyttarus mexicanus]|nr:hypothetical protein M0802_009625 [Mischocyttarus mexicanus]